MIKVFSVLIILLSSAAIWSQSLVMGPESVIFDPPRNRYIVSNWTGGTISLIDTLWFAADNPNRVIALDLITAETLLVAFPTISQSDDFFDSMILDTAGNAYISVDKGSEELGQIYKMRISDQTWSIFADEGIRFPQTLRFISEDNSLIINSAADNPARVSKINIADASVTHLIAS